VDARLTNSRHVAPATTSAIRLPARRNRTEGAARHRSVHLLAPDVDGKPLQQGSTRLVRGTGYLGPVPSSKF